jgi:hypothetical protein
MAKAACTGAIGERELAGIRVGRADVSGGGFLPFNDPPLDL